MANTIKKILYSLYPMFRYRVFILKMKLMRENISIGKGVFIHWGSRIKRDTTIGDYTRINGPLKIKGKQRVHIGKYCAIGWEVTILSTNHAVTYANTQYQLQERHHFSPIADDKGPTIIGNNVWIGDRSLLLAGVNIGDGAVIGAGSVITKDIPPFAIVAGVPATTIRKRFDDEMVDKLMEIGWWNWSEDKIRRNREFFETDLSLLSTLELENIILK